MGDKFHRRPPCVILSSYQTHPKDEQGNQVKFPHRFSFSFWLLVFNFMLVCCSFYLHLKYCTIYVTLLIYLNPCKLLVVAIVIACS